MKHNFVKKLYRIFLVLTVMAVFGMMVPQSVQAADGFFIDVVSVKADDTVTLRFRGAPANRVFTIRMDVAGNKALNGIVVADTNSGAGGNLKRLTRSRPNCTVKGRSLFEQTAPAVVSTRSTGSIMSLPAPQLFPPPERPTRS
jgi:hypothetical protein